MKDKRFRKSDSMVYRKVGHQFILIPIRHDVADLESIFTLNEVSARIWDLVDGRLTVDAITERIVGEFEVNRKEAEEDVMRILGELRDIEGIEEVGC